MTTATAAQLAPSDHGLARMREAWAVATELAKARLSFLVVLTASVGYIMASGLGIEWLGLVMTSLGVGLAAGSANAFNQVLEVDRDRKMPRTSGRPLPTGRVTPVVAVVYATVIGVAGVGLLAAAVNVAAAALALLNIGLYVLVYTPLKVRTTLNTLVGAVVGAVPPLIGWVGATGTLEPGAWVLAGVLFAWQMPHFLALAWLYREQYAQGGYRMLPQVDPSGRLTGVMSVLYAVALVPITLAAVLTGIAGGLYAGGAVVLGVWLIALGAKLLRHRTAEQARRLFIASVLYLPLLMGLMVIDRSAAPSSRVEQPEPAAATAELSEAAATATPIETGMSPAPILARDET